MKSAVFILILIISSYDISNGQDSIKNNFKLELGISPFYEFHFMKEFEGERVWKHNYSFEFNISQTIPLGKKAFIRIGAAYVRRNVVYANRQIISIANGPVICKKGDGQKNQLTQNLFSIPISIGLWLGKNNSLELGISKEYLINEDRIVYSGTNVIGVYPRMGALSLKTPPRVFFLTIQYSVYLKNGFRIGPGLRFKTSRHIDLANIYGKYAFNVNAGVSVSYRLF